MLLTNFGNFCENSCRVLWATQNTDKLIIKAKIQREKKERLDKRQQRGHLKTLSHHKKETQVVFNKYIRKRDEKLPCISCQRHHRGQYHAGHYLSVGAHPELRFNENNCHKQCSVCNNHLSGNQIKYRVNLVKKIGLKSVEELETNQMQYKHTKELLSKLKSLYKEKFKNLN